MQPIQANQKITKIDSIPLNSPYVLKSSKNDQTQDKQNELPDVVRRLLQARKKGEIRISFGRWNQLKMNKIVQKIQQLNCFKLELIQNNDPLIIKELSPIKFKKLQVLNLQNNGIESVQMLTMMDFPHLEQLQLQENKINSIKSLRKLILGAKYLHAICLTNNPLRDLQGIQELNAKNLSLLTFSEFAWSQRYIDIKPIAKIQAQLMKNMNVRTSYRIKQVFTLKKIVQRWPGFSIITPKFGRIRFQDPNQ